MSASGSVRIFYYHRHTGARLHGNPGSPRLWRPTQKAEQKPIPEPLRFMRGLIRAFLTSPEFGNNLQTSTQKSTAES